MADLPGWIPGAMLIVLLITLIPRLIALYVAWRVGLRG